MSKKKSIIISSILFVIIVFVTVFTFTPMENVGQNGIYDYKPPVQLIKLGLDLKGGVYVTFDVKTTDADGKDLDKAVLQDSINQTAKILQDRLAAKGYTEATVTGVDGANGGKSIRVEIPNVSETEDIFSIIAKPAKLKVYIGSIDDKNLLIEGKHIQSASAYYDTSSSSYAVNLTLKKDGQKLMADKTAAGAAIPTGGTVVHGTTQVFFVLDGKTISQPKLNGQISGKSSSISGLESAEFAKNLAVQLNSGTFDVEFKNVSEARKISAKLGEQAIQTTLISGVIVLVLICIFMILIYGLFGVAASFALLCYTVLMVLALAFIPFAQLTLPGIAGIILGIGMAVDANIIIFERIKEEYKLGRKLDVSIKNGFSNALSAILDSNITTLIGAIVLYLLASGAIQGFAITLIFSIVISLLSSLVFTRGFIKLIRPFTDNEKLYRVKKGENA